MTNYKYNDGGRSNYLRMRCLECNGDGEVELEYTVGGFDGGPWQEYRVKWVECETCNGTGEIEDEQD